MIMTTSSAIIHQPANVSIKEGMVGNGKAGRKEGKKEERKIAW
jgi:hypothetical protein